MDTAAMIELFGYIGSALVVVSMLMSSVVKLRVINTVGSVISGIYAVICGAFPLFVMNACLIVINIYNLFKLLKTEAEYDLVECSAKDALVNYFLEHYHADIKNCFPEFDKESVLGKKAYVVCCNATPASVLLGEERGDTFDILLDYAALTYRDCSVGAYLYAQLLAKGIHTLVYTRKESETHISYMRKMGFVKEQDAYIKRMK